MGLFDKKYCDICGEKIKFLGNNKLEDGNMCNACEKKLSVWFKNRRHSTVADMKDMLAAREENARMLQNFRATRELGHDKCVLIDDNMGRFIVMGDGESMNKNPELFELSKVQSARLEIKEDKSEVRRKDANGSMVSYNPRHYSYKYIFYVVINYNSRYINEMRVRLNGLAVNGGTDGEKYQGETFMDGIKAQFGFNNQYSQRTVQVDRFGKRHDLPGGYRTDGLTSMADIDIQHYQYYENEGNEIVNALMGRSSAPGMGVNAAPVRAGVSSVNNVNSAVSQAELQKNLMEAIQSGDPLRVVEANNAILNAGMVPDNMQAVQNQRKILELKSQAMKMENTDFYGAASLYRQALDMGDKDYDGILGAYLNWINKPGSAEADCQELIRLAGQAKAAGFDQASAENFISIANMQLEMRRQGIQPSAYSPSGTAAAPAAKPVWTCEYCGKSDNTGKFCLDCGAAKP